jgi:hypothetical protein
MDPKDLMGGPPGEPVVRRGGLLSRLWAGCFKEAVFAEESPMERAHRMQVRRKMSLLSQLAENSGMGHRQVFSFLRSLVHRNGAAAGVSQMLLVK